MNVIQAKQKAINEFEDYMTANHYTKGTLYIAVSRESGEAVIARTLNAALSANLMWVFEVSNCYGEHPVAVLCES